jgi:peptidoglycan/xylan/chitin deacetylase (PgdA/CDA1 family)
VSRADVTSRACPGGAVAAIAAVFLLAGCAALPFGREPDSGSPDSGGPRAGSGKDPATSAGGAPATPASGLPEAFESEDFVVAFPRPGDTPETLAARYLGDRASAWMIEDFNRDAAVSPPSPVVIPKHPWNLSGVEPGGYQLVPVLVYHNMATQARGRLVIPVKSFDQQMRYLKEQGYRVVSLRQLYEFVSLRRQLPRKAVVLTFDDGYRSFYQYAYPILKELGFTATLFIYTDYVGAGRNALTWDELRFMTSEGFDVQAHSKTHSDLRRRSGEPEVEYQRRMQAELGEPQALFERHLGRRAEILAYPYGYQDEDLIQKVREFGYVGAFTVRREGNPVFVYPLRAYRSQIYAEMTLEEFAKSLTTFSAEPIR